MSTAAGINIRRGVQCKQATKPQARLLFGRGSCNERSYCQYVTVSTYANSNPITITLNFRHLGFPHLIAVALDTTGRIGLAGFLPLGHRVCLGTVECSSGTR